MWFWEGWEGRRSQRAGMEPSPCDFKCIDGLKEQGWNPSPCDFECVDGLKEQGWNPRLANLSVSVVSKSRNGTLVTPF